ncbi:hypothetical protein IHE44_0014557 [Lamprotornis superbus]|uniref:Transmembrane protein 177 n=1 Tax=Lamprotornis superbus TaxID=245042 RepID=A0A835U0S6_9PASS|nr:hypothetical protein IHE44_0014557 [Lamprotornis superbus]
MPISNLKTMLASSSERTFSDRLGFDYGSAVPVEGVCVDTGVKSTDSYRAFAASGFHPVSAGIPWLPAGSLVGIPLNFDSTAEDKKGIVNHVVVINGKKVDWESSEGMALKEALTFSLKAQKFAIAREVVYLQSGGPLASAVVAPTCLAGTFVCGTALKLLLGLSTGPLILRSLCNLVTAMGGLLCYSISSDAVTYHLDCRADRKAARLSEDYARGGLEFYDKILFRNRIFRGLMGKQGMEMYAPSAAVISKCECKAEYSISTSKDRVVLNHVFERKPSHGPHMKIFMWPRGTIHLILCKAPARTDRQ